MEDNDKKDFTLNWRSSWETWDKTMDANKVFDIVVGNARITVWQKEKGLGWCRVEEFVRYD